jgi:hypothetical protein
MTTEAERAAVGRPDKPAPRSALGPGKINRGVTARNLQRHRLNSAVADASRPPTAAAVGAASVSHGRPRVVKLDGTRHNRNAAAVHERAPGTTRSSPDAGTVCPQNLPIILPRAGPRARRPLSPARPARRRRRDVAAAVPGNAGSAPAAVVAPARWRGSAAPHANAATGGPHPGTTCCNSDATDGTAGTAAHTLSTGKHANTCRGGVARKCRSGHNQGGPRECLLPQVKSRSRAANSTPRRSY